VCTRLYMFKILTRPFPSFSATSKSLRMSVVAGICVFGVLTLLKPFSLHELATPVLLKTTGIYGLATLVVTALVVFVLPRLLPSVFAESHWTVAHEIVAYLFILSLVAFTNLIINIHLYNNTFSLENFLSMLTMVLSVGILPVVIGVVVKQKVLLKRYEAAARETEALVTVTKAPAQVGLIKLQIEPERLLLLTASDNYVEIFFIEFIEAGKIKKQLFRNTLKTMESAMSNQPQFYRCHKAHIVNLKKVIHVSGNAQGLKLEIEGLSELVPVSRNLTTQIKERLKQI
jgi:hypothetical protein